MSSGLSSSGFMYRHAAPVVLINGFTGCLSRGRSAVTQEKKEKTLYSPNYIHYIYIKVGAYHFNVSYLNLATCIKGMGAIL